MKNKRWLNSITNFDNLYNLLCFSITMTQQTQKMWEISTQHGKQNLFSVVISHARKNSQGYGFSVNEINSIAIIYNHPIYLFTSYVIKINK